MTRRGNGDELSSRAALELRVTSGRLRRRLLQVAGQDELSPAQASVLARLAHGDAGSAAELAALEGVRPQSMSAIVAALETAGLIARAPDPSDGRRQLLALTRAGRRRYQGQRAARQEWLSQRLRGLSDADLRRLIDAMALVNTVIDR